MAERGQPSSSCLGLAKRPRRTQQGAADYFSFQVPLRKDMALFMLIDYQSRNSLVGGGHSGSGRWRVFGCGEAVVGGRGCSDSGFGSLRPRGTISWNVVCSPGARVSP